MRIYLFSIGCRLNQSEMDSLARQYLNNGHQIVFKPEEADLCVLNSCAVTKKAEQKSRKTARRLIRHNPAARIVVTGCDATLSPKAFRGLSSSIQVIDNDHKSEISSILGLSKTNKSVACGQVPGGRTRAFVKVQDGCDNRCTYCVTTIARGKSSSRPLREIITEVNGLVSSGYQEIVLTGVHLGSYGLEGIGSHGISHGSNLPLYHLIRSVLSETDIRRLRLSSLEPMDILPDFFELWSEDRLCRQLHLPLQSGSERILHRMGRRITPSVYQTLATTALASIPELALTTDIIVGFPGETAGEHQESLAFIKSLDFSRLHVFGFSPRPGTAAAKMHQVSNSEILSRSADMRDLGSEKERLFYDRHLGKTRKVLWESLQGDGSWQGHTDNYIKVVTVSDSCLNNQITRTRLTDTVNGGMLGTIV